MASMYFGFDVNSKPVARGDLRFCIDAPNDHCLSTDKVIIRGWVVHKSRKINKVVICTGDGKWSQESELRVPRPGVRQRFEDYFNSKTAGFELNLTEPTAGNFMIVAVCEDGREIKLDQVVIREFTRPRLLFMHIAKTAGSTVNRFFQDQYPNHLSAIHVESNRRWLDDAEYARSLEYVSGHITYSHFANWLDLSSYYKVTLLREPFSHIQSHLAWIKHLSEPAEASKLSRYPEFVRGLSKKLWHCDLADPDALKHFVASLQDQELVLLDNCQTRYLADVVKGAWVNQQYADKALETIKRFDRVGKTEAMGIFLQDVSRAMKFRMPALETRENVSGTYYGLDTGRPEIREILQDLVHYDQQLYQSID